MPRDTTLLLPIALQWTKSEAGAADATEVADAAGIADATGVADTAGIACEVLGIIDGAVVELDGGRGDLFDRSHIVKITNDRTSPTALERVAISPQLSIRLASG